MKEDRIPNYREFWKFYVGEHSKVSTRWLHFTGTGTAIAILILSPFITLKLLWVTPVAGYLFAWIGHFACERNRPATFTYPLWSLLADFNMFWLMLTGRMNAEVQKYGKGYSRAS